MSHQKQDSLVVEMSKWEGEEPSPSGGFEPYKWPDEKITRIAVLGNAPWRSGCWREGAGSPGVSGEV